MRTVETLTAAINEARHNVNNALTPLMGALDEVGYDNMPHITWPMSERDTRACLERIRDAMRVLARAAEDD